MRPKEQNQRPREFLTDWCRRLDGGPYPAYRDLQGRFDLDQLVLEITRVQPDPFAGPSRIRFFVPYASTALSSGTGTLAGGRGALLPGITDPGCARAIALRDGIARQVAAWIDTKRSGLGMEGPGQQVLDRAAVLLCGDGLEIRLTCDLPARGRRILGREAARLLVNGPEDLVRECLAPGALDRNALEEHVSLVEDFAFLQQEVLRRGWVAFIADGSRLARRAGNDDRPLPEGSVPFQSPAELRAEVMLPHGGRVSGMPVPPGVTLLCGGGFHGKSTLLRALSAALYPHVKGDGRERTATRPETQSIRAEDGRAVSGVDLRPFLHDLPFGRTVADFTTANASGSTSQAASIIEAVEGGARALLLDEDTSATNFMIRDSLMERLLEAHQEPITPYLYRARALHDALGTSSVIVVGGSGEYFRVADRVLLLDTYRPLDRTEAARRLVESREPLPSDPDAVEVLRRATAGGRSLPRLEGSATEGRGGGAAGFPGIAHRDRASLRVKAVEARRLLIGKTHLELDGLESMRELSQARFLSRVLEWRAREPGRPGESRADRTADFRARFEEEWRRSGLDGFDSEPRGDLAAVRFLDLLSAVNRLRPAEKQAPGWKPGRAG